MTGRLRVITRVLSVPDNVFFGLCINCILYVLSFSLSALADVLGALSEQRSHIPYRNTRLTHMLSDTIGRLTVFSILWLIECFVRVNI